jgi:hypothetical protein
MPNVANQNAQGSTGTTTLAQSASLATWRLKKCSVSQAGPTIGPNARVQVFDGTAAAGTVIHCEFLPGAGTLSIGSTTELKLPSEGLQASPGAALTIVVDGTGANRVSINAQFGDGLS